MGKRTYCAAGGVVIADGLMLLLDRPSRGEVRLPKGHIEADEDAQSAALREVAEESGYCDLLVAADLGQQVIEFDYAGSHVVREEHYFLLLLQSDAQIKRSKKDAAQFFPIWKPIAEAIELLTYAAEREVAQRAAAVYLHPPGGSPVEPKT
jgi:8-oxo-dGTP pyrophosphatase MutT (NUDIX family)